MKRFLFYSLLIPLFLSCQKDKYSSVVIKGTLLQSSSNPVPVTDYTLSFYQGGSSVVLIGTSSSTADFTTNSSGYFECKFPLGDGYFIIIPSANSSPLRVSGGKNAGIQLGWDDVSARDTDLHVMYLYKKVHRAIVQIEPKSDVVASDTFYISSPGLTGVYTKIVTGLSIPQNTVATIDTIPDVIFTSYSFQTRRYRNNIIVKKNYNSNYYTAIPDEVNLDEEEKTYVVGLF